MKILAINCKPDLTYFTKRGLIFDVSYDTDNTILPMKFMWKKKVSDTQQVDIYSPDTYDYLDKKYTQSEYDIIIWGWSPSNYGAEANYTGGVINGRKLSCGAYTASIRLDQSYNTYIVHELHHLLILMLSETGTLVNDYMDEDKKRRPYYLNNEPENPESNYAQTWNEIKPYLSKLNNYKQTTMYKYFKPNEIVGLKPELVLLLDKARGIAGIPFKINSGFRTKEQNKKAGGVEDSAHLISLAVDIACTTDSARHKIFNALQKVGFNRIGIAKKFIHCDIDKSKSPNVIWLYD